MAVGTCAQPVQPIKGWSPQTAARTSVGSVVITNRAAKVPEDGIRARQTALEQRLAQCATRPNKYEMQVRLDNFKLGNSGMVMLLGAAECYVQERTQGGGLIGLAVLSGGSRATSTDFAKSVGEKDFNKK